MRWSVVFTGLFVSFNEAELATYFLLDCSTCFFPGTLLGCEQFYSEFLMSNSCESCHRGIQRYIKQSGRDGCYRRMEYDAENIKFAYLASQLREKFIRNRTAVQSSFLEIDADYGQSQMEIFERQRRFFNYTDAGLTLYHVQMVNYTNGSICGGVAVSPYHIITAASCFHQKNISGANNMVIYIGCTGGFGYGTVMTIRKVFVHPEFKKNNQKYDVALVYTKKKIDSSEIIKLASRNVQLSDKGTITGFGQYREFYDMNKLQDIYPKRLKTAHLTVHFINETRNFLTNGRVGPNDLGDPLVLKRNGQLELIGILKGTDSESGITYPHFLNVWAHKTWITKVIERSQRSDL